MPSLGSGKLLSVSTEASCQGQQPLKNLEVDHAVPANPACSGRERCRQLGHTVALSPPLYSPR